MARKLDVYLHRHLVGHLTQDDQGKMRFKYVESWRTDPNARPLSHSLPLQPGRFSPKESVPFFGGTLPEEDVRKTVARNLGISARNDFAMLAEIGGENAGAVTVLSSDEPLPDADANYRELSTEELTRILADLPRRPLMAGEEGVRLSLAGVQDKLPVRVEDGRYSLPLGTAPSTHIIKPGNDRFPGLVANEAYCMELARVVDIPAAGVSIHHVNGIEFLLVERYDRTRTADGQIERLHQEDFCQALGIPSVKKYQKEGGPGIRESIQLVRDATTSPVIEIQRLVDAIIFNLLIGNNDAHGKNFSLLYGPDRTTLAPLYDIVSTAYYPGLSKRMAMSIGGEDLADTVNTGHFETMAERSGLNKRLVVERVGTMADRIRDAIGGVRIDHPVAEHLESQIKARCEAVLEWFR